jgi:hypothetical protein
MPCDEHDEAHAGPQSIYIPNSQGGRYARPSPITRSPSRRTATLSVKILVRRTGDKRMFESSSPLLSAETGPAFENLQGGNRESEGRRRRCDLWVLRESTNAQKMKKSSR